MKYPYLKTKPSMSMLGRLEVQMSLVATMHQQVVITVVGTVVTNINVLVEVALRTCV